MPTHWAFERIFLITDAPVDGQPVTFIKLGLVAVEPDKTVTVVDVGGRYSLEVSQQPPGCRQKHLLTPSLVVPLAEPQFAQIWPHTLGRRMAFTRTTLECRSGHAVIEDYAGNLAPLRLLRMGFDTELASHRFTPPPFAGAEVTANKSFSMLALIKYGLPELTMPGSQAGFAG